ncbi:hypothetical protein FBU30_011029 [Linnemannia zychae]|nr:hypothetical protein FBU30_011029 [Linnemannia zychae]
MAKFDHRAAALDHSSRTLARDFQAFGRTPPLLRDSPSPEQSCPSPPVSPKLIPQKDALSEESHAFFNSAGSLQDIILGNLRDGRSLPAWARDRPLYTFKLQLRSDWGPQVTELYETTKAEPVLDHTHIDKIAMLSGILHLNKNHVGFSEKEIKTITQEVLETLYSQDMKIEDVRRARDANLLWGKWMQAIIGPVWYQSRIVSANTCTSVGKTRKAQLQQDGQSRQPDVIGQTEGKEVVFFGELKGTNPKTATVNADILRLAIFSKDSLDRLHNVLVRGPLLLTFQSVGCDVTFFLGAKIDNTIVHVNLSTVKIPSRLDELDLDYDFFFKLLQVQTLISISCDCLAVKREEPEQEIFFPTLGTPERNAALKIPAISKRKPSIA